MRDEVRRAAAAAGVAPDGVAPDQLDLDGDEFDWPIPDERREVEFRSGMSLLAGAVTVIATGSTPGRSGWRGMTATAVCSLCARPPTLVACVNRDSGTWQALRAEQVFSVNVLAAHHVELARTFAGTRGLSGAARFTAAAWRVGRLTTPVLADALASFECRLADAIEYGTHVLVIGGVDSIHPGDGQARPLLYHRRRFHGLELEHRA